MFIGGRAWSGSGQRGDFSVELSKRVFGKCVYLQDVFKFLIFMEFNPFDYRPFLVRERVAVEEFTQESPVWERAWEMYREKDEFVPEHKKLDVLNDLRYLLVRAQHTQGEVCIEHCNTLLKEEALREVAGSLLADLKSPTNPFQPDLSLQGEVPERIPYVVLKAGMPVDFLRDAGRYYILSLDKDSLHEKLASIAYSKEEMNDLEELFTMACLSASPPAEQLRRLEFFDVCNCKVKDEKLADFHRKLADEMELRKDKPETVRLLPLAAAQKAGCLVSITQNTVNEAFPQYNFSKKISDYNTGNIAKRHKDDLNALTEKFRAFLD